MATTTRPSRASPATPDVTERATAGDVGRAFARVGVAAAGVAQAAGKAAVCKALGHDPDPSVPSPAGMRYCGRCCERYPVEP